MLDDRKRTDSGMRTSGKRIQVEQGHRSNSLAARQMALRAIMDGRGLDSVILCQQAHVAHYADPDCPGALVVVTAGAARLIKAIPGDPFAAWGEAAALLRQGCALGHDGPGKVVLDRLEQVLAPERVLDISAELRRQIGRGDASPPP